MLIFCEKIHRLELILHNKRKKIKSAYGQEEQVNHETKTIFWREYYNYEL